VTVTDLAMLEVGAIPPGLCAELALFLGKATGFPCRVLPDVLDPGPAYDAERGQYDSRRLLPAIEERSKRVRAKVLAIADVDIFSTMFTFVFGEATLGGGAGIFSLHRLRPDQYGLPPDPALLHARARREALHETGHLLGLVHCREPGCVMRFSGSAEEVDLKLDRLCPICAENLAAGQGTHRAG
jgi:archaemetzincin